ncbi:MAG: hypothetical protein NTY65_16720 [Planctomycetota bacterium]|nr:hypothetical protein [Planctomycetota bacterium]
MAIEFKCPCGAICRADESRVGELFHCDACGLDLPVPATGEAPLAEVVAGPTGPSVVEEFKAQVVDRSGFNEMMQQLHGVTAAAEVPGSPAAPAAGSTVAGSGAKPLAMAAGMRTRGPVKPATPVSRAAHHFGFKKVMWGPTLGIALVCIGVGIWCFLPHETVTDLGGVVIKEPEIVNDAQGEMWAIPRGNTPSPHDDGTMWSKDAQGQESAALKIVRDAADRAWAVPPGKTLTTSKSGKVFYQDDAGFDVAAESAERWLDVQGQLDKIKSYGGKREQGYLGFGIALLAVGLVLAGFGVWLLADVRQVRREQAAEAEKAAQAAAAKAEPVKPILTDPTPGGPVAAKEGAEDK